MTLRIVPGGKGQAARFFQPLADRVDAMMRDHPEPLLHTVIDLLDRLHVVMAEVLEGFEAPSPPTKDRSDNRPPEKVMGP